MTAKVLLIDDEQGLLNVISKQLKKNIPECSVIKAQSGDEGFGAWMDSARLPPGTVP